MSVGEPERKILAVLHANRSHAAKDVEAEIFGRERLVVTVREMTGFLAEKALTIN
jgi:hypothetical protein